MKQYNIVGISIIILILINIIYPQFVDVGGVFNGVKFDRASQLYSAIQLFSLYTLPVLIFAYLYFRSKDK